MPRQGRRATRQPFLTLETRYNCNTLLSIQSAPTKPGTFGSLAHNEEVPQRHPKPTIPDNDFDKGHETALQRTRPACLLPVARFQRSRCKRKEMMRICHILVICFSYMKMTNRKCFGVGSFSWPRYHKSDEESFLIHFGRLSNLFPIPKFANDSASAFTLKLGNAQRYRV